MLKVSVILDVVRNASTLHITFLLAFAFIMLPIVWTFAIIAKVYQKLYNCLYVGITKSENKISLGNVSCIFILQNNSIADLIDGLYKYKVLEESRSCYNRFCVCCRYGRIFYYTGIVEGSSILNGIWIEDMDFWAKDDVEIKEIFVWRERCSVKKANCRLSVGMLQYWRQHCSGLTLWTLCWANR